MVLLVMLKTILLNDQVQRFLCMRVIQFVFDRVRVLDHEQVLSYKVSNKCLMSWVICLF